MRERAHFKESLPAGRWNVERARKIVFPANVREGGGGEVRR